MALYKIMPSRIAALVYVQREDSPAPNLWAFMYASKERGIVTCDSAEKPLDSLSLPEHVKEHVRKHLEHVFGLRHEDWKEPGPSPRSVYVEKIQPWHVAIPE